MDSKKIRAFMELAGQKLGVDAGSASPEVRALGAQLLLSETLEYVIKGLGVIPQFNGVEITDPNALEYAAKNPADKLEMLDGLSDVAYTMYWNSECFGLRLEEAFEAVCNNNLDKFVKLESWSEENRPLERQEWSCGKGITWPDEVVAVEVLKVNGSFFAVGKDRNGKVRKPSSYKAVSLEGLV